MDTHTLLCRTSGRKKVYGPTVPSCIYWVSQLPNLQIKVKNCMEKVLPNTTETFIKLSSLVELSEEDKEVIERFVCFMYERGTEYANINQCRQYLFTRMSRSIENCPPTSNVLEQHMKWAQLQASIWVNALKEDIIVDPTQWGLEREKNYFKPLCSTLQKVADVCPQLKRCQCKKQCGKSCICFKNGFSCSYRCLCGGKCSFV